MISFKSILFAVILAAFAGGGFSLYQANRDFTPWTNTLAMQAYLDSLKIKGTGHDGFWDHRHWVEAVEGRWHDGDFQERVRFGDAPPKGAYWWWWWVNADQSAFDNQIDSMLKEGATLVHLETYLCPDGSIHYDSVWHKVSSRKDLRHPIPPPPFVKGAPSIVPMASQAPSAGPVVSSAASQPDPVGVRVSGHLLVPTEPDISFSHVQASLGMIVRPPFPEDLPPDERPAWFQKWRDSPEGKAALAAQHQYPVTVAAEGSFNVEGVVPGNYQLNAMVYDNDHDLIAHGGKQMTVPEMATDNSTLPDLGVIDLRAVHPLKIGEPAPDFSFQTVDNQTHALSEFRGKWVLLDFWATWCQPCREEMPYLKATYDAFATDPRLVMVSMSLDHDIAQPRDFSQQNGLAWTQGFLGDWPNTKVPDSFGVWGIPSIFLIDPTGKVAAKDLRRDAIKEMVAAKIGD